jgi:hypothetical protein
LCIGFACATLQADTAMASDINMEEERMKGELDGYSAGGGLSDGELDESERIAKRDGTAAETLRASAQAALGQVKVLTRTLDAMARDAACPAEDH